MIRLRSTFLGFALLLALAVSASADEGMWLYTAPPRAQIKAKYGFDLTDAWLDNLMKSSVRFISGGSGSFVSGDGLVITNFHIGRGDLLKMSNAEHNYVRDGFYAKTPAEEMKCLDLELNVLQSIEDVTARVNAAVPADATGTDAALARRKIFADIEKESLDQTGLRSDVVTLYQGGVYHLYRYKRYTDIRIVFAPEEQAADFGGDPDNFEFPRFDLDICIFRVYENGQPVHPAHFLKWSATGAQDGELTFVSGHPGTTRRLLTIPEIEYMRDSQLPYYLQVIKRREVLYSVWSGRADENARRADSDLLNVQNNRKRSDGQLAALQDPVFFGAKVAAEQAFKQQLAATPNGKDALAAFDRIVAAQKIITGLEPRFRLLEDGAGFNSASFSLARRLLRAGAERPKPNGERLPEFSDAKRESFEQLLFSNAPIYSDFEILKLADSLGYLVEQFGADDPLVQSVLAGKSPRDRAAELINTTQVRDLAFRKKLYEGGADAVAAAHDPMIELARVIDPESRALRKTVEAQQEIIQEAHAVIEKARFALEGTNNYPDATFTLRLAYGPVKSYEENGQTIPALTTFAGLFARDDAHHNREPFGLPARWLAKKSAVDLTTPLNFVNTADIIGGNSGSPVVNEAGEFVGIIFDGNIQSLSGDYGYSDVQTRSVSVHSAGILEALRKIYDAPALAAELFNGHR